MKNLKIICSIIIAFTVLSCKKSISEKELKRREGKWEIVQVENGKTNSFSEDNLFGTIEFFDDGTGEMRIKNLDYSDVDQGIVISFYLKADVSGTPGFHLDLQGIYLKETGVSYEYLKGLAICYGAEVGMKFDSGFFGGRRRKKVVCEFSEWPECLGMAGGVKWHMNLVK